MISRIGNKTPGVHKDAFIAPNATLLGDVSVGERASVWFGAVIRGDSNSIKVGERSNIQDLCVLHCDANNGLSVGSDVTVGHRAILHGCKIEDRVLIGMGSTIMNGAVIGKDSIVGAGALVTEGTVVPPRSLILGVPAKVKRALTEEEISHILWSAKHYAENAARYLSEMNP